MSDIDLLVGARLREKRFQARLSLSELAARIGAPPARLLRFEDGQERVPAQILAAFCRALEVKPAEIFALKTNKPEQAAVVDDDGRVARGLSALSALRTQANARRAPET
nr:helix-turn-helix transcriptional regulator [Rhodoblastus acidophilus]